MGQEVAAEQSRSGGRPTPARPRHAFTLIELLVVISIMMILMGLSVASVVKAPRLNRMIAAEQVVADCIRQARHTARTSGQPVVLRLKKDERSISGLVRQTLWQGVEGWPKVAGISAPGRTGTGLILPEAYATGGALGAAIDPTTLQLSGMLPLPQLNGGQRIWRGQASPSSRPGLLLSVAVRPPIPDEVHTSGPPTPQVVPLVMVGPDAVDPIYDDAVLGLALVQSNITVSPAGTGSRPAPTKATAAASWEIIGWFGAAAQRVEVSSISDVPVDQAAARTQTIVNLTAGPTPVSGFAESGPLTGGRWTEISLLVENDRLVLYRDGRRVGEKAGAGVISLPVIPTERIFVGCAKIDSVLRTADYTQLDDVRLERLGDAMAGVLPSGVKLDAERRIVCHPDGRVEVDVNTATNADVTIVLSADSGERAELIVTTTGEVSSLTKAAP